LFNQVASPRPQCRRSNVNSKHTPPAGSRKRCPGGTCQQIRTDWLERLALCLEGNAWNAGPSWSSMSKTNRNELRAKIWVAFQAAVTNPATAESVVTRMGDWFELSKINLILGVALQPAAYTRLEAALRIGRQRRGPFGKRKIRWIPPSQVTLHELALRVVAAIREP